MQQINTFADDRLIIGCVYCGGPAETRDHVPTRHLLEPPYPENLPVIGACKSCNQGFSKDEQYLACLIEAAIVGSTDPDKIRRPSVARTLTRSPALQSRISAAKKIVNNTVEFSIEADRVKSIILKLAKGHAAFELSQPCHTEPEQYWCCPLNLISPEARDLFDAPHVQQIFGEIGSRGFQRLSVTDVSFQFETGEQSKVQLLVNDWVCVQDDHYRYLAIDEGGLITIRIVIAEYLACQVVWR